MCLGGTVVGVRLYARLYTAIQISHPLRTHVPAFTHVLASHEGMNLFRWYGRATRDHAITMTEVSSFTATLTWRWTKVMNDY